MERVEAGDAVHWHARHVLLESQYEKMVVRNAELLEALKDAHPHIADGRVRAKIGTAIAKATAAESEGV